MSKQRYNVTTPALGAVLYGNFGALGFGFAAALCGVPVAIPAAIGAFCLGFMGAKEMAASDLETPTNMQAKVRKVSCTITASAMACYAYAVTPLFLSHEDKKAEPQAATTSFNATTLKKQAAYDAPARMPQHQVLKKNPAA